MSHQSDFTRDVKKNSNITPTTKILLSHKPLKPINYTQQKQISKINFVIPKIIVLLSKKVYFKRK